MTGESVGKLFIGGIIPGVILSISYTAYIAVRLKIQPSLTSESKREIYPWSYCLKAALTVWPIPVLFIAVMGSIYTGFATPTEAAAVGCATVFIIALAYRAINLSALKRTIQNTVVTSSMVLMLCLAGKLVGVYLGNTGVTVGIAANVGGGLLFLLRRYS